MKRSIVLTGMVLALAACGGAGDEVGSSGDSAVIESSDGMASLTLSPASLPEDVSIDDIHLEWIVGSSDEPGAPFAGVQLSPSGLSLSESATLRIDVPTDTEELFVVHGDARGFEFAESHFESAADRLIATIEIEHFSVLTLYGPDIFIVTAAAEPLRLTVGEEQFVTLELEMWNPFVSIWIWVGDENTAKFQRFDFRVALGAPTHEPNVSWWNWNEDADRSSRSRDWSPNDIDAAVSRDGNSLAMAASSQCIGPNSDTPRAFVRMALNLQLIDTGPVVTSRMLDFIGEFEEQISSIPSAAKDEKGSRIPFTLETGESVQATQSVARHWNSECLAAPVEGSTSTSTSTSSPPVDEDASSMHLVGSAGDFTCKNPDNTLDPALDITGVDVVQDGDEIEVTLTFDGDAEAYENATTEKFPFSFQLRLKEDTAGYPEVFFAEKGEIKVSGGLLQVVSYEFSGKKLIIRLKGRTLEDVHAVQASTFIFDGGRCQDLINSPGYND